MVANKNTQGTKELTENDVLFDHDEDLHYVVRQVSPRGVTLFRDDREYYIPHAIFSEWYTKANIRKTKEDSTNRPNWVDSEIS